MMRQAIKHNLRPINQRRKKLLINAARLKALRHKKQPKENIMFTKVLKWLGIVLGGLIFVAAVLVGFLYARGNARLTKKYDIQPESVVIPTGVASVEVGKHWASTLCMNCHGNDLSGKPLVDDQTIGFVPAPNLTAGEGGAGGEFAEMDWVRALRHGVDPEGRALIGMPSMNYYYLSDKDLGAVIAYVKSVPPVDHDMGEPSLSFMGKVLLAAGGFGKNILPAEVIDHTGTRPAVIEPGVNAEYGSYLVRLGGCRDCHSENLTGGKSPEPGAPHAPDLTPNGPVGAWSKETFITSVRTMEGKGMPWQELKPLSDSDLEAIFLYLQSLPTK
jgi:mono/diheme cytochrome c family protein